MRLCLKAIFLACLLVWAAPLLTATSDGDIYLVDLNGPVGPASVDLVIRSIADANDAGRTAVILRMNTPGGLDKAMRDLVQAILASNIPVITYVAPNGARAASAGTYIAYASHIAAMAPATNIGSSTPVSLAPQALPTATPADEGQPAKDQAQPLDAMGKKVINDAVAYLQGLAELRGRNIEWAEKTVREGANLRASEALEQNVIDLIAPDLQSLLEAIHGREVETAAGTVTLETQAATIKVIESDWRHDLLATITDPSIAYGLLIVGIYALMLEFYNPGLIIPAVTGVILILLGAYGLQLLPVNYAGVGLVFVGVVLMVAEVMTPALGVLGIGGLLAFVLGSMIMFDSEVPGYGLPISIIAAFATATAATVFFVVGMAVRARRQKVVSGEEAMIGASGIVLVPFTAEGEHYHGDVRAFGEVWQARSENPLLEGAAVRVDALDGLILEVSEED
jgi:membrane-bound serine protease (ClpP class)